MDLVSLYEICRRYDLEVSFRYNPSTEALIINIDDTKFGIRRRWSGEITKEEIYSSGNKTLIGSASINLALRQLGLIG